MIVSSASPDSKTTHPVFVECRHYLHSQAFNVMKTAHEMENKVAAGSYWSLVNEEGELKKEIRDKLDKLYNIQLKLDFLSGPHGLPK